MPSWPALIWFLLLRSSAFRVLKLGEVGAKALSTTRGGGATGLRRHSAVGPQVYVDSLPAGGTGSDIPHLLPLFITSSSSNVDEDEDDDEIGGLPPRTSAKFESARSGFTTSRSQPKPATPSRCYDAVSNKRCTFVSTFVTRGDYFLAEEGLDHAVFCSPQGIRGGNGAACEISQACAGRESPLRFRSSLEECGVDY
ncbi:BQ2448_3864 [Microbotryum intermedium]|uniref:BQ2448_3864 protein n=1 Tax=Microbotryum intermedium TaxID=269621 RepID=A0A238FGG3_9BASI|nr:BQ2448_3864 [Microbotryum intermedium]